MRPEETVRGGPAQRSGERLSCGGEVSSQPERALEGLVRWDGRWERFYRRALPAYWIFLFVATHFPKLRLPEAVPRSDKLAHFAAYALLALLFWKFFEANQRPLSPRFCWNALAVILVYAAVDEALQPLVGRSADVWDWICDVTGAAIALAALEWNRRRLRFRP